MTRRALAVVLLALALASAACGGDSGADTPSASLTAPPTSERRTTTRALTPEEEVEAAYLRSWEVYAKAMLELDDSELPTAYAGAGLTSAQQELEALRAENKRVRYEVEHDYRIEVNADIAMIFDDYINHSVELDGDTRQPLEPDPNEVLSQVFVMQRREGTWKVVEVRNAR